MPKILLAALVLFLSAACNDDSPSPTSPPLSTAPQLPPAPPAASRASIDVEVIGAVALVSGQGNLLLIELRMREEAGVGANINFIRVEVFRATGEFEERQEIGANTIISSSGNNRLEANATRQDVWGLLFNATVKKGRTLTVTVGFTDDRGNDITRRLDFVFA